MPIRIFRDSDGRLHAEGSTGLEALAEFLSVDVCVMEIVRYWQAAAARVLAGGADESGTGNAFTVTISARGVEVKNAFVDYEGSRSKIAIDEFLRVLAKWETAMSETSG